MKLGKNQLSVLKAMTRHGRSGVWFPGCGWYWDTASGTVRIMESLERKGLVTDTSYDHSWKAAGATMTRRVRRFEITEAGRQATSE